MINTPPQCCMEIWGSLLRFEDWDGHLFFKNWVFQLQGDHTPGKSFCQDSVVEPRIQEEQCGFHPGCGTEDQLFIFAQLCEGSWEYANPVYMLFVDLWEGLHDYTQGAQAKQTANEPASQSEKSIFCSQINNTIQ